MKTFTAPIQPNRQLQTTAGAKFIPVMANSIREILALLSAVATATAIVLFSIWLSGLEFTPLLGAGIMGVGFIFFGLAIDNFSPVSLLQLGTGIALLILAWLQNTVSPDYTIVSGAIVATWVAIALFRRLR